MNPFHKTSAIVLKKVPYSEGDWIVSFLSKEGVKFTGFAPMARRSLKRFGGCLDLFNLVEVSYRERTHADSVRLEEAGLLQGRDTLRKDLQKFAAACYFAELVSSFLPENHAQSPLFDFMSELLIWLDQSGEMPPHLLPVMEHRLLDLSGFKPRLDACLSCHQTVKRDGRYFFNGRKGGVVCSGCTGRIEEAGHGGGLYPLNTSTIERLIQSQIKSTAEKRGLPWGKEEVAQSRQALEFFIQFTAAKPLKSLKFLAGVLG